MFSTFQSAGGQLRIDSKLWSDFGAHIPLIRSFSHGDNFPPEYPTFPGEPIRYHFLFYLIVGSLEKTGINIGVAFNTLSAIGFSLLLFMIYKISTLLFSNTKAALLAIVLFLFNGSLSFFTYFKQHDSLVRAIQSIPTNTKFPSFGPWDGGSISAFWNLNIYTNQRHLSMGLGLSLVVIWTILKSISTKRSTPVKYIVISCLILLILPTLHQASFIMTISTAALLLLFNLPQPKKTLIQFSPLLLAIIPGLIYIFSMQGSHLAFDPGFLSQDHSAFGFIKYWFFNLGVYLILIPCIFFLSNRLQKTLLLSVTPLFIAANLVRLSPDMINNHKLINYFMIFVVILTAGQLALIWQQKVFYKPIVLMLVFLLTFSGFIDLFPIFNDSTITIDDIENNPTAAWIDNNTPPKSVFLTTTYLYNPASLAGRKTYTDYGYFNWSMGYDDAARKAKLPQLFSQNATIEQSCSYLIQENIDYVMIFSGPGDSNNLDPHQSTIARKFQSEDSGQDEYQIFAVTRNCNIL